MAKPSFEPYRVKAKIEIDANAHKRQIIETSLGLKRGGAGNLINEILKLTLQLTIAQGENWIRKYVPRATGQLQDNLIEHLQGSKYPANYIARLFLGVDPKVNYIQYVANMPEHMVRHHGQKRWVNYYGQRGTITLWDPQAQGHFWGMLIKFCRAEFKKNLFIAIKSLSAYYHYQTLVFHQQLKVHLLHGSDQLPP